MSPWSLFGDSFDFGCNAVGLWSRQRKVLVGSSPFCAKEWPNWLMQNSGKDSACMGKQENKQKRLWLELSCKSLLHREYREPFWHPSAQNWGLQCVVVKQQFGATRLTAGQLGCCSSFRSFSSFSFHVDRTKRNSKWIFIWETNGPFLFITSECVYIFIYIRTLVI